MDSSNHGGYWRFQSTFPRGERPDWEKMTESLQMISIHVPAWGTTVRLWAVHYYLEISIHVPAWGTTQIPLLICSQHYNFNPRSRVGNDSIPFSPLMETSNFNPRSRVGNDDSNDCKPHTIINFNPRSRVGND